MRDHFRGTSIAGPSLILTPEKPMLAYRTFARLLLCGLCLALTTTIAAARQRPDFGTLSIQVRPPDAEIIIDGERWTGSGEKDPLQVQLVPGRHSVEIRSPGRQTFIREITIRAGETTPLNVALTQGEPSDALPAPASPPPLSATTSSSRIVASPPEDGFVIAPDVRFTEVNHHTTQMVGAYGGYVFSKQLLVGFGGYWQADSSDGAHILYGGPVFEWRVFPNSIVGLNLHGLMGAGWRYFDGDYYYWATRSNRYLPPPGIRPVPGGYYNDGFFVAEPEAQVVVRFGSWIRAQAGIGYRATSTDGLSGTSGSISMQFGK
jgi:hypothetical protein